MRLKKSLSQIFLTNRSYLEKISRLIDVENQIVVEAGPGSGRMTQYLLGNRGHVLNSGDMSPELGTCPRKLYAVELDERMCLLLGEKFQSTSNLKIIHGDILNFDFSQLGEKAVFYGNIPYGISKKIVEYLIKNRRYLLRAYILCQKEFAEKLTAKAGSRGYGFLSCRVQYCAAAKKLLDVPRVVFSPPPKVDSTLVEINFRDAPLLEAPDEEKLFALLALAFRFPRKQIGAILKNNVNGMVNLKLRPQDISLRQYIEIARAPQFQPD